MPQENNPYAPPQAITPPEIKKDLQGLGGWLILVGIVIVSAPFKMMFLMFKSYVDVSADGIWQILTDPNNDNYLPYFKPLIIFEYTVNILMLITWLIVIYLFFTKKKLFKKFFIGILVVTLAILVVDNTLVYLVLSAEIEPSDIKDILQSLFACILWSSYTLKSKRVANTFIN